MTWLRLMEQGIIKDYIDWSDDLEIPVVLRWRGKRYVRDESKNDDHIYTYHWEPR